MNEAEPSPPEDKLSAKLGDFLANMDARAWRAVGLSAAIVVFFLILLIAGRYFYGDQIESFIDSTFGEARRHHWGLAVVIAVFTLTAYVGAPQFVLILACVVAFGPIVGFWYAWIATVVSGAVTYYTGRLSSAQTMKRFGGATGGRFTAFMSKNAFLASAIVRLVPTAPFLVVNMAFGAARVSFWPYIAGLALGVLPKTAMVAFFGEGVMNALEGEIGTAVLMALAAVAVWIFVTFVIRRWVKDRDSEA